MVVIYNRHSILPMVICALVVMACSANQWTKPTNGMPMAIGAIVALAFDLGQRIVNRKDLGPKCLFSGAAGGNLWYICPVWLIFAVLAVASVQHAHAAVGAVIQ